MERKASLVNPKHQYRVPNRENMIVVPITKRKDIIMSVQVCLISPINFDYKENDGKKKLFFQIQSINIVYSNVENMIVVPIIEEWGLLWVSKIVSFQ